MSKMTKIRIMGHDVAVRDDANFARDHEGLGGFSIDNLWIALDTSYPPTQLNETLLHELVEAINYFGELKLQHPIITRLSSGLHQILADNPEIINFLSENWRKHEGQKTPQQYRISGDTARKAGRRSKTARKKA